MLNYRGGDLATQFKEGLSWKGNGQRILQPSFMSRHTTQLSGPAEGCQTPQSLDMHPSLESSLLSRHAGTGSGLNAASEEMPHQHHSEGVKSASNASNPDMDSANGCLGLQQPRSKCMWPQSEAHMTSLTLADDQLTPMDLDEHPSLESLLMRQETGQP